MLGSKVKKLACSSHDTKILCPSVFILNFIPILRPTLPTSIPMVQLHFADTYENTY